MVSYPYTLAIDPGGNIGIAIRAPDGKITTQRLQTQEQLWDWLKGPPIPHHVIIEEWTYRTGEATPGGVLTASIVSSVVGICYVLDIPVSVRTPGSRYLQMKAATDYYTRNRPRKTFSKLESHEIDALAHLFTWETQQHARIPN